MNKNTTLLLRALPMLAIALALGACPTAPMNGPVTKLAGANAVRDS